MTINKVQEDDNKTCMFMAEFGTQEKDTSGKFRAKELM